MPRKGKLKGWTLFKVKRKPKKTRQSDLTSFLGIRNTAIRKKS